MGTKSTSDRDFEMPVEVGDLLRPLRLKMGMLRPLRPKLGMLRPLRLKMGIFRPRASEEFYATLRSPKRYVATLCHPKQICCEFTRPIKGMLRFCATQASCGMMEIRSQKIHFGDPFRSQHKSRTSTRKIKIIF